MRTALIALAAGLTGLATPAFADPTDEGARVELRSGVTWPDGQGVKGEIGGAVGYDAALGGGTFVGVEESVDKTLASGYKAQFATQARLGTHVSAHDKLYATAGYAYGKGPNAPTVGGGWEHGFGGKTYTKVEYKHLFTEDGYKPSNAALVGVGVHF